MQLCNSVIQHVWCCVQSSESLAMDNHQPRSADVPVFGEYKQQCSVNSAAGINF